MIVYITKFHSYAIIERPVRGPTKGSALWHAYDIYEIKPCCGQLDWFLKVTYSGGDAKRVAIARADALERNAGLGEIERSDGDIHENLPGYEQENP